MKEEKDLLKGAIADAKKIRETALANAKKALEEAFTPQLQSMFSQKVQEEADEDEEELPVDVPTTDDAPVDDVPVDDAPVDDEEELDEEEVVQADKGMHADEGDDQLAEEDGEELPEEPVEDDLDLDEIIAELEDDEEEDIPEPEEEPVDDGDAELDIDIEDDEEEDAEPIAEEDGMEDIPPEEDEEIDLQELYDELMSEDEGEDEEELDEELKGGSPSAAPDGSYKSKEHQMQNPKTGAKINELEGKLEEAYDVIKQLRTDINEVNLLNAKLLFANKLFKKYNLNEGSKRQVIETLDRAQSGREAKLIFVTLAESMGSVKPNQVVNKKNAQTITEGLASKSTASTKPNEKQIVNEMSNRWMKLANIKK